MIKLCTGMSGVIKTQPVVKSYGYMYIRGQTLQSVLMETRKFVCLSYLSRLKVRLKI